MILENLLYKGKDINLLIFTGVVNIFGNNLVNNILDFLFSQIVSNTLNSIFRSLFIFIRTFLRNNQLAINNIVINFFNTSTDGAESTSWELGNCFSKINLAFLLSIQQISQFSKLVIFVKIINTNSFRFIAVLSLEIFEGNINSFLDSTILLI